VAECCLHEGGEKKKGRGTGRMPPKDREKTLKKKKKARKRKKKLA